MLARRMLNTVLVMVIKVLDDEYGWKKQRLSNFITKFTQHTIGFEDVDPYGDRYVEMSDYAEWFNETYDAGFSADAIEEMIHVENQNKMREIRRVQVDVVEKNLRSKYPEAWEHLKKQIGA